MVHRSFTGDDNGPLIETVNVAVGGDGSEDRLCRTATDTAAAAVARLPSS
ncbi:hypothetical protein NKH77_12345 [Streptomyces sp. M19]